MHDALGFAHAIGCPSPAQGGENSCLASVLSGEDGATGDRSGQPLQLKIHGCAGARCLWQADFHADGIAVDQGGERRVMYVQDHHRRRLRCGGERQRCELGQRNAEDQQEAQG